MDKITKNYIYINEDKIMGSVKGGIYNCAPYPIFEIGQILFDQQDDKEMVVLTYIEAGSDDGYKTNLFYLLQTLTGELRLYGPKAMGSNREKSDKDIRVVDQACLISKNTRIAKIKKAALAKLTDIEKEVLGLS